MDTLCLYSSFPISFTDTPRFSGGKGSKLAYKRAWDQHYSFPQSIPAEPMLFRPRPDHASRFRPHDLAAPARHRALVGVETS